MSFSGFDEYENQKNVNPRPCTSFLVYPACDVCKAQLVTFKQQTGTSIMMLFLESPNVCRMRHIGVFSSLVIFLTALFFLD